MSKEMEPLPGLELLIGSKTMTLLWPLGSMISLGAVIVTRTLVSVREYPGLVIFRLNLTVEPA